MTFYRRHLPHWDPGDRPLFVTWRLRGSLPLAVERALREQRQLRRKNAGRLPLTANDAAARDRRAALRFRAIDRVLDSASTGPRWLQDARVAHSLVEILQFGERELKLYRLNAYVVMSNHVHILIHPFAQLAHITRTLKGYSARKANQILRRPGRPFWQDESFDHWVRDEVSLQRIIRYIEANPVSAGLVKRLEDWPWSSAAQR